MQSLPNYQIYKTEITSFSPKFPNTSVDLETTKTEERHTESDIKPSVKQLCSKYSTLNEQPNFRSLVFFMLYLIKKKNHLFEVEEFFKPVFDAFVNLRAKQINALIDLHATDIESKIDASVEKLEINSSGLVF